MKRITAILIAIILVKAVYAEVYTGRVVDQKGSPIPYATVYPETQPEFGTATNSEGVFSFEAFLYPDSRIIISFIGYEKLTLTPRNFNPVDDPSSPEFSTFTLLEQPIALEETVVAAKASKQKNKRKQMASLLHAVYVKLEEEFPDHPALYQVVSDVRMQSEGSTWGMEQMIANIVVLPEQAREGRDSIQFQGRFCKRFFSAEKRAQADSILASDMIERMDKNNSGAAHAVRRAVNAVDSGVVVHQALFGMGNMRYDFEQTMGDTRHWSVSNESEGETVLTHTQKISRYLGLFRLIYKRHYIVDSETFSVRRFSEHAEVKITIPFGYKLNADQLQMLNLLNMDDKRIEKFRLKKMRGKIDYNTIYQRRNGQVYTLEKNMDIDSHILGSKKAEIPVLIRATQRVTSLQTEAILPLTSDQITRRVARQIVEIY